MNTIIRWIVRKRRTVFSIFILLSLISIWAYTKVAVNYDIVSYLPQEAPSTIAVAELTEQFGTALPNARVSLPVEGVRDGLILKGEIEAVEGVSDVLWLDDSLDLRQPLELADPDLVSGFLSEERALYQLVADTDDAAGVITRLYEAFPEAQIAGNLVDLANAQSAVIDEMLQIVAFALPVILLILLISTHSWLEPLVFLLTIGVSILLNMGSNIFLGEISFMSQAISAVLQLAVSMDYAIFLLHSFNSYREEGHEPVDAMQRAMRHSLPAIFSSAVTTVIGFLALLFMRFRLGADLGLVMAKGIALSSLTVMIFMPTLILLTYKWIDRTRHRSFLPDFTKLGKLVVKGRWGIVVLVLLIAIPSFLASRNNDYIYGMGAYAPDSRAANDIAAIEEEFGHQLQLALMVPRGDVPAEQRLQEDLEELPTILSVMSYVSVVDPTIPADAIADEQLSMLLSEDYSMFILTSNTPAEGEIAFSLTEEIRDLAEAEYGDRYHLTGEPVNMKDMKDTVEADEIIVNGLAILAIALTILFVYRSLSLPIILVLTIEIAIWINLGIPYFTGTPLSYIGYLIVSTVQLGATVDYAILYTQHYLDNRKQLGKRDAVIASTRQAIPSILPPAVILTATGFILGIVSSLAMVRDLGNILGRGALLSFLLVAFLLPVLLMRLDSVIQKTTLSTSFISEEEARALALTRDTQTLPVVGAEEVTHEHED